MTADTIIATKVRPLVTRSKHTVGTFTLNQLAPQWEGHTIYLVSVDSDGIRHFAGPRNAERYAGLTIGAMTGVRSGWAVTAYVDRAGFLAGGGGWYAPFDVKAQPHGVRILLTYYWLLNHPDEKRTVDLLTANECKRL